MIEPSFIYVFFYIIRPHVTQFPVIALPEEVQRAFFAIADEPMNVFESGIMRPIMKKRDELTQSFLDIK